jgi:O-antigen/teichoic acid export membrane protein
MSPSRAERRPAGRHRAGRAQRSGLLGQFLWLVTGRVGGALLQAVTLGLLARWVGPAQFGLVAGVLGAAQVSIAVSDLGISPSLLRIRATDPHDPRLRSLLLLNRLMSTALLAVWVAVLGILAGISGNTAFMLLLGVAVWVSAEKNTETFLMVSLADGRTQDMLLSLGLRRTATVVLLAGGVLCGLPALLSYGIALASSGVLGATWTWRRIAGVLPTAGAQPMRPLLREALPFWLNSMAIQGRNLDVVLVGLAASPATAGVYAAPSRLSGPLALLPSSLAQVLLPTAARAVPGSSRQTWLAMTAMTACTTLLFGLLALVADDVLPRLLGPGFSASVTPLRILLVGLIFFGVSASLISVLQAYGDERYVAAVNVTVLVVCLPVASLAASRAGAPGAAVAMAAGYAVQAGALGQRARTASRRRTEDLAFRMRQPDKRSEEAGAWARSA